MMTLSCPGIIPLSPRGEGRGEGDAQRAFPRILAMRPPHPNPLPRGERGSAGGERALTPPGSTALRQ
ncbi:hypothetical protein FZ942_13745 [Azospirillum lipoferum]|uniref:Uncharacterized protein n=1 Tax=Azospirillum lipoferum TaxID=193 RepID=A0A5A9GP74_AZOLI|nr:hypothetical protein FZ942_13745 [Azospirillum lipoferum]